MRYIFLSLLILLTACSKGKVAKKNILNYALTSSVSTLDPAISYDTVSAKVVYQIYEALYEYDYLKRPYQLVPNLADSLPVIEDDGLTYHIKLKSNVYYHEHKSFKEPKARKVISKDFVNQIKRLAITQGSNGWWLFEGKIKGLDAFRKKFIHSKKEYKTSQDYLKAMLAAKIEGLDSTKNNELVIKLTQPYPQLIYALAMAFTTPVTDEVILATENNLNEVAIGTGPYYLTQWKKNSVLKLEKFNAFHTSNFPSEGDRFSYENELFKDSGKSLPFIEQINFHIMKESQTRWLNFLSQKIDLIVLTKDHFPLALDNTGNLNKEFSEKGIELQIAPTLTYWWLAFNMTDPILGKNLKLRKAFAHAINIDEYIKSFTNNIALKANSIYPPGVKGYDPSNTLPYEYNLEKAKKLLEQAGYPNGKGLPEFSYDVRGSTTVSRQMGEFIEKELEKIGVKIKVNLNSFPGFLNKAKTGQLQLWQGGWAMDYPDPENVIQLLISKNHPPGPNSTYYSNHEVDKLYKKLFFAEDEETILKITKNVEDIVSRDLPWVMQFYSRNYILHHKHLKNFRQSDLINNNFKYLKIEP